MGTKFKCPNCEQTDKGFLEFVPVQHLDNDAQSLCLFKAKSGLMMGLLCRNEGCGMFGPEQMFVVDPTTGDCVGRMPDDPY